MQLAEVQDQGSPRVEMNSSAQANVAFLTRQQVEGTHNSLDQGQFLLALEVLRNVPLAL